MSTTQHSIIPLTVLTHAAIEATGYSPQGNAVIVYSNHGGITDIAVHPLPWLERARARPESDSATALIFPDDDMTEAEIDALARQLQEWGETIRDTGGVWDTILAHGSVRFRIYSDHGWLDEPELDPMSNERLDELIEMFAGTPSRRPAPFDLEAVEPAAEAWIAALEEGLAARSTALPAEGSLQSGAVRDAVIVWAVGEPGNDRLMPGERFAPPTTKPDPRRVDTALELLAARVGEPDTVHALACAADLAWWSGYTRAAAHLYYRVRQVGQRSRLATLVWTAMIRQIPPRWMS